MSKLKFLVRYEGLDGREDEEKVYTFDEMLDGEHEGYCFDYSGEFEKRMYKIEEIQSFNFDGWISVEDDLPGTYVRCLCFDGEDSFIGYLSSHNEWWEMDGERRRATHWQYLPNPPKNEKE